MANVQTIGTTGRNWSTMQGWVNSLPGTLTQAEEGQCYNDSAFNEVVTISGHATSATNTITLTTAAGQSFQDNANAQTNALKYNQSNGVGNSNAGYLANIVGGGDPNVTISKLQLRNTSSGTACFIFGNAATVKDCILDAGNKTLLIAGTGSKAVNCFVIARNSGANYVTEIEDHATVVNCTIVAPSDVGTKPTSIVHGYLASIAAKNCALFGGTAVTGGATITFTTCYTDVASPPAGCTTTAYSTSSGAMFQGITGAATDYRIQSGSSLLDVATTDTTDIPAPSNDIVGTARPQGSAWDVGCWELVVSSGGGSAPGNSTQFLQLLGLGT